MQKDSQEYQDACELWEIYEEVKAELLEETFGELSDHYVSDQAGPSTSSLKGPETMMSDTDATDLEDFPAEEQNEEEAGASSEPENMEADEVGCVCVLIDDGQSHLLLPPPVACWACVPVMSEVRLHTSLCAVKTEAWS